MANSITPSTPPLSIYSWTQLLDSLQFPSHVSRIVCEYGGNQEYLTHIALGILNTLWDPAHGVLRAMIRCEHSKDKAAGWNAPDLPKRLAALDEGQKAMKSYFDRRIPEKISYMDEWKVNLIVSDMNRVVQNQKFIFDLKEMCPWFIHTANFGSEALKTTTCEEVQSRTPHGEQEIQLTIREFFASAEIAYETPMEQFVDRASTQVEQLLPHLTNLDQLIENINLLIQKYVLFGVQGPNAFTSTAAADSALLGNMITRINEELNPTTNNIVPATHLLIPKTVSTAQPMNPALHDQIVRTSPLATIAFRVSGYSEANLNWFDSLKLREKCVTFKTSRGEERAILMPSTFCWNVPFGLRKPAWLPAVQAMLTPMLSASMEDTSELARAAIEKGFGLWIDFIETTYPQYASEIISDRVGPLITYIRLYRDALLHTVLAGLKKERAGWFGRIYPSHFHDEFTNIFLKGILQILVTGAKEHGIKPLRTQTPVRLIDLLAPAVATIQKMLKQMEEQFQAKTK